MPLSASQSSQSQTRNPAGERPPWPTIRSFAADHLDRISMPLGGVGTGCLSLGGRGDLRDFTIVNRPANGWTPDGASVVLWCRPVGGKESITRCCEGPLATHQIEGESGATAPNHGLPRFAHAEFSHAYPFGQVRLADPAVPLRVRIDGWNPLIPGDSAASGQPVAILRYVVENPGAVDIDATLAFTMPNFIGYDGSTGKTADNHNRFTEGDGLRGFRLVSDGVPTDAETWGSMALATTHAGDLTWRTHWEPGGWNSDLLAWWDDLTADGRFDDVPAQGLNNPRCSLAAHLRVPAGGQAEVTFLVGWHFPNRQTWTGVNYHTWPAAGADGWLHVPPERLVGNWYCSQAKDAWAAVTAIAPRLAVLEERTREWVAAFCASDLPPTVIEASLANLSTLRTQTCFRITDGTLMGWEGVFDRSGSCYGSCTHVWNYEQAVAHLFPDLARSMRRVEFKYCTHADGHMNFRADLPLEASAHRGLAAADGQLGCLLKLHRDWRLSGDDQLLDELWPAARRAMEFCWLPGGWDADCDGVIEGCQHNTMDVEYFGPNPQMGLWYLGALRATAEMATHRGETDFAAECMRLAVQGGKWMDANLWNGEYYIQKVVPPTGEILSGLRHGTLGSRELSDPDFQIGTGCLVDQLVGQVAAHVSGLGPLTDPAHLRTANASVMRHNFRPEMAGHFNHMRSYAVAGDAALLMATWPHGGRPRKPFPYSHEVMTGFEYAAAAAMIWDGEPASGLKVVESIRARYDGRRRSPFDEAECGHHYARAMASWGIGLALTGFGYDAISGTMRFRAEPGTWFWSIGSAWGTVTITAEQVTLRVGAGQLKLRRLRVGEATLANGQTGALTAGSACVLQR